MANVKISALPAATTPLAGTEEVPIVQSSATVKATISDINASSWSLTGNTGTNDTTNFIGTTDIQDLVFKVNNTERLRISATTSDVIAESSGDNVITAKTTSNNGYASIGGTFIRKGFVDISNGTNVAKLSAVNCTDTRFINLPNYSGTLVATVNGSTADDQGNVVVPRPYNVYTAVISQQLAAAPTVDFVLENTLGFSLSFNYVATGEYTVTNVDGTGWVNNKTIVFLNMGYVNPFSTGVIGYEYNGVNQLTLYSKNSSTFAGENGLLFQAPIEIRVYP